MVIANRIAEIMFTQIAIISTDNTPVTTPNAKASSGLITPLTSGLLCVLFIIASMSLSYHILIAAADPAPIAINNIDDKAIKG